MKRMHVFSVKRDSVSLAFSFQKKVCGAIFDQNSPTALWLLLDHEHKKIMIEKSEKSEIFFPNNLHLETRRPTTGKLAGTLSFLDVRWGGGWTLEMWKLRSEALWNHTGSAQSHPASCATRRLFTSTHIVFVAWRPDRRPMVWYKCVCVWVRVQQEARLWVRINVQRVYNKSTEPPLKVRCVLPSARIRSSRMKDAQCLCISDKMCRS